MESATAARCQAAPTARRLPPPPVTTLPSAVCLRACSSEGSASASKYGEASSSAGGGSSAAKAPSKPGSSAPSGKGKSSASSSQQPPDFGLAETHEVIKLLGRGGEGETWLCRDKQTRSEVAVKLIKRPIPKPAIAVIKREIKIQADLGRGHSNIVSADEVILSKTHLGLVMEYVPGMCRGGGGGEAGTVPGGGAPVGATSGAAHNKAGAVLAAGRTEAAAGDVHCKTGRCWGGRGGQTRRQAPPVTRGEQAGGPCSKGGADDDCALRSSSSRAPAVRRAPPPARLSRRQHGGVRDQEARDQEPARRPVPGRGGGALLFRPAGRGGGLLPQAPGGAPVRAARAARCVGPRPSLCFLDLHLFGHLGGAKAPSCRAYQMSRSAKRVCVWGGKAGGGAAVPARWGAWCVRDVSLQGPQVGQHAAGPAQPALAQAVRFWLCQALAGQQQHGAAGARSVPLRPRPVCARVCACSRPHMRAVRVCRRSCAQDTMRIGTPEYMGPELISSR